MNEIIFRGIKLADAQQLAILHLQSLQDGLLYDLGQKYTKLFYKIGLSSDNCFGYIAEKNGRIIGAAVSTKNSDVLFRKLLLNPRFLLGLLKKIFHLKKLYPSGGTKIPIKQEFILFFVDEEYGNLGYKKYSLEVKESNTAANLLYQRFGFIKTHEIGKDGNKRLFYEKLVGEH